jgi:hypothetical protein
MPAARVSPSARRLRAMASLMAWPVVSNPVLLRSLRYSLSSAASGMASTTRPSRRPWAPAEVMLIAAT